MATSDGGKGSARRPGQISDDAWERTFGKKSCCDEYCSNYGCNQGRDCPARVAKIGKKMQAAEPLQKSAYRQYLGRISKWILAYVAVVVAIGIAAGASSWLN